MDSLTVDGLLPELEWRVELPDFWRRNMESRIASKSRGWSESPSSITSFVSCPGRWFAERYAPSRTVEERRTNITMAAIAGSAIHRCLEVFYTEPPHRRSWSLLSRIEREMMEGLTTGEPNGIADVDLVSDYALLLSDPRSTHWTPKNFRKRVASALGDVELFDVDPTEVQITSTEQWIRCKVNAITIHGKIDRVVGDRIDDYKTGRPLDEDVPIDPLSPPLIPSGFYAYAYNQRNPGMAVGPCTEVNLLYLGSAERICMNIGEAELAKTGELMDRVTRQMTEIRETGLLPLAPAERSDMGSCNRCPLSGVCPAYQEDGSSFEGAFEAFGTEEEIAAIAAGGE